MLIVKKFGGTSVGSPERIMNVAIRCVEDFKKGHDVVVVLSAMGKTTDDLIALAHKVNPTLCHSPLRCVCLKGFKTFALKVK